MWLSFALASALLLAVRRIYEKKLTDSFGNFSLSFVTLAFSLPFLAIAYLFVATDASNIPRTAAFWVPLVIIWVFIYPVQNYFLYRSLREGEFSEVIPISALLPVFNVVTSLLVIGESPTPQGAVGIALTVCATWLLLGGEGRRRFNMPVLFMIISVLCTAIGATLDKVAIEASAPLIYSLVNIGGGVVVFAILTFAVRSEHELVRVRDHLGTLLFMGALLAFGFVIFSTAFALGPTSYTLAIRSGGFLAAALWGIIALNEPASPRKLLALALFSLGTLALALG